jgi:hypothetical protein
MEGRGVVTLPPRIVRRNQMYRARFWLESTFGYMPAADR